MSLMKTLAKVAIGVAVAKGAKSMMNRGGGASTAGAGGLGGLLGGLTQAAGGGQPHGGAHSPAGAGGGLEDMLGGMLGGAGGGAGGLGGLLESLGGARGATGAAGAAGGGAGGLGGLLGGLASAAGAGGLLGGAGGALANRSTRPEADFGAVLNSHFDTTPEPAIEPSQDQEAAAALMLAAMIQAAKSDGTFDEGEREKLLSRLGDVDAQEAAFVKEQMAAPVDVDALARQTPKGMGPQVYAMSVLGIDLDTQEEAQYLHKLATALGMMPAEVNRIHTEMGVPTLYS